MEAGKEAVWDFFYQPLTSFGRALPARLNYLADPHVKHHHTGDEVWILQGHRLQHYFYLTQGRLCRNHLSCLSWNRISGLCHFVNPHGIWPSWWLGSTTGFSNQKTNFSKPATKDQFRNASGQNWCENSSPEGAAVALGVDKWPTIQKQKGWQNLSKSS